MTFDKIAAKYIAYIKKQFQHLVIVFDDYTTPSGKEITHHNRSNGVAGPKLILTVTLPLQFKKEVFLSNPHQKQNFINWCNRKLHDNFIKNPTKY